MTNNICKTSTPNKTLREVLFNENPKHFHEDGYQIAWLKEIRKALGDEILHSGLKYDFKIENLNDGRTTACTTSGPMLCLKLMEFAKEPCSVKIENLTKGETLLIIVTKGI